MKMSEKTLLKKIEQAFAENYCTGSYKLELQHDYDEASYYVLFYTYETGETISVDIVATYLGELKFYSPVHGYYISNFNNHIKSVINVLRMLFDLIDSNKDVMINYYAIKTEEPEEIKELTEDCNEYKEISNMRKSNNYFKFLEYVTYGKDHDNTIDKGNGVLECKSYTSISDIEDRYKTTFGLENEWLTFKNVLINEDTLYVYYLDGENSELVSVYSLDNFKTQKELKESITKACIEFAYDILLEKSEETEKHYYDYTSEDFIKAGIAKECTDCPDFCEEDCIENAECARGNDVFDGCKNSKRKEQYFDTDSCIKAHKNFIHDCEQVHKQMKAKSNPEWHHVSLATLSNIDFDMLDEKRQRYITVYRELQETLARLRKCKTIDSYDKCCIRFKRSKNAMRARCEISNEMRHYIDVKLSMQNVESGVWASDCEDSTGFHKSRRYNKSRIDL